MARKSGIWWNKERQCWYTWHNGKKHRLDPDKKKAEWAWAKLVGQEKAKGDDLLVKQVTDAYLDWSEANHAQTTYEVVRAAILNFAGSLPPCLTIGQLEPHHFTAWLDRRYPKRKTADRPACTDNTRHHAAGRVLAAFNWAAGPNQRMIRSSPLHGYRKPPKTPRVIYVAPRQMADLFSQIKDREFHDFLMVMLRTGCRPAEARVLEARHILLQEGVARIPKELAKGKREVRVVPLDETVQAILRLLVLKYPDGPVLRNTQGRPWTRHSVNCRFQRLKKNKGIDFQVNAYAMRHTFANEALLAGASEGAIAEVMGHRDKTMVLKVYGHPGLHKNLLQEVIAKANRRAVS